MFSRTALRIGALLLAAALMFASAAPAPAAPAAVYIDNRSDAVAVLQSYFNAISRKEYARAYGYWEAGSSVGSFASFQAGFATTESVVLTTGMIGGDAGAGQFHYLVPVILQALNTHGTTQTFAGCYVLHISNPSIQASPPFHPLAIQSASVKSVPAGANAGALQAQACAALGLGQVPPVTPQPTPGSNEIAASVYVDNRSGPIEVLQSLFNAVNRKEYARAYGYWEPGSAVASFAAFARGYQPTQAVQWAVGPVTSDAGAGQFFYNVAVTLKAQTTGGAQTFVGCYTLHLSNPGAQAQPPFRPIGIRSAQVSLVANTADTAALMQSACQGAAPAPTAIRFAAGATSATITGNIAAGATQEFTVRAGARQLLFVDVTAQKPDVFLEITGRSGGQVLVSAASRLTHWQGTLPATQSYSIRLVSTGAAQAFSLAVTIPRRIAFGAGSVTGVVPGSVTGGSTNTYVLRASAGQTMTAILTSADRPVWLEIVGLADGQALIRSSAGATQWTGKLPATQDYLLRAVSSGQTSKYSVKVTIR